LVIHGLPQYVLLHELPTWQQQEKLAMWTFPSDNRSNVSHRDYDPNWENQTARPTPARSLNVLAGIVGIVAYAMGAVFTVVVAVGGFAAMLWAATVIVALTAAAVLMPASTIPSSPATLVAEARANYAPLASADDGVKYAADRAVNGLVYARDGVDFGVNWTLQKLGL
jgi:hypothetical protein